MRVLLACLVAACATTTVDLPLPQRLAGCWVARDGGDRLRWAPPDAAIPNSLRGRRLTPGAAEQVSAHYALDPDDGGYVFCELADEQGESARCWQVAEGVQGSLEGGRAFIDFAGSRLRITVAGDGPERVIFSGRRESCS